MRKTFEYAVGDSWLLELKGEKTVYTVKDCKYRPEDGKEIYTVAVGNAGVYEITKNRLHFLIHCHFFKKLKNGKHLKYEIGPGDANIRAYYAHLRAKEKARADRAAQFLDGSPEYRAVAQEVSALSMRLAKAEYIRADAHEILQLKKQLEAAKERRRAVLSQLGLKQGEEKRRVFCDKCGDTGFLTNGRQCSCVAAHEAQIRAYAAEAKRCKATV